MMSSLAWRNFLALDDIHEVLEFWRAYIMRFWSSLDDT